MAIFVDENTKVVVQGITGSQGKFYALRNRAYGTNVVAGTNPKKAGTGIEGVRGVAAAQEAREEVGADTAMVIGPAPCASHAILEAAEAGIELIVCLTEGIPAQDE